VTAYPLAAVVALRSREVERAAADLARALDAAARLRSDLERHDGAIAVHARRAADEAWRIAAGESPGIGGLAARARWAGRLRAELAALVAVRGGVERSAAEAQRDAELRREALAAARGDLAALEAHRDGWRAAEARRRERREQDAADDLVSARRAVR
jgi:hypothetical protein